MIPALRSTQFADVELDGSCCVALLDAKHRALAILHDCPQVLPNTIQLFNQLTALPDANDLTYRQASPEEWLACAIKALIDADTAAANRSGHLERYAAKALEHAGRILKHQQGLQDGYQEGHHVGHTDGYQEHVAQATATLEKNLQKAEAAKQAKGEASRELIIKCYETVRSERGNQRGNRAEVARRLKISPARVSQVLVECKIS